MKIQFWSVGKTNESYIHEGVNIFTERINRYFPADWLFIPAPKNAASLSVPDLKKAEAKLILNRLDKDDYLLLSDERGKQLSSIEFSKFLQQRANEGTKKIVILIGGAFGVSEEITKRADFVWSLSALVFPHIIVRLILAEQVYRACTILKNEKYHHV